MRILFVTLFLFSWLSFVLPYNVYIKERVSYVSAYIWDTIII